MALVLKAAGDTANVSFSPRVPGRNRAGSCGSRGEAVTLVRILGGLCLS